jgi:hypothetical protein
LKRVVGQAWLPLLYIDFAGKQYMNLLDLNFLY